jgi:hypothetical protein
MQIDTLSDTDKANFSTFLASRFKETPRCQIKQTWGQYLREDGTCTHGGNKGANFFSHVVWYYFVK